MSSFLSLYRHGFARVAACSTRCAIADPATNAGTILAMAARCEAQGVAVAVFPELGLSGYAIDDLLLQDPLLDAVEAATARLVAASGAIRTLLLVGAPLRWQGRLYNCALAIQGGRLLGVVPKVHLPNYREFYEHRHFASGQGTGGGRIALAGQEAPFGPDLLFAAADIPGLIVHAEICEDVWVPVPPSSEAALAGATVLANLSASNITIGKAETRRLLCQSQSARCLAAYVYAASGPGESTTDLAWDGQCSIFENGAILRESERFPTGDQMAVADVDLDLLRQERARQGTFDDNRRRQPGAAGFRRVEFTLDPPGGDLGFERPIERFPFVPADPARLAQDCYEAYSIQVSGLEQRLVAARIKRIIIGVSGGLDFDPGADRRRQGDGPAGPAAHRHHRLYPARLRHQQRHQGQCPPADGGARHRCAGAGYPPGGAADAGRPRPPLRPRRAGLRHHLRERAGRAADRLPVPRRQPA